MEEFLRAFITEPRRAGIFLDFDGTLSDVVPIPSDARPVPGARNVLARIAAGYGVVAVVSGRSARELVEWLGGGIEIWGTHGAERVIDGEIGMSPEASAWTGAVRAAREQARERVTALGLDGVVVEDKTVMIALHWRNARDPVGAERDLRDLAAELAAAHSLVASDSKMAVELKPPLDFSKGDAVLGRVRSEGLGAAMFIGDDIVDLPAFDALDELSAEGVTTLRVAVESAETPAELVRRADLTVRGPGGVIALLEELATAAPRHG